MTATPPTWSKIDQNITKEDCAIFAQLVLPLQQTLFWPRRKPRVALLDKFDCMYVSKVILSREVWLTLTNRGIMFMCGDFRVEYVP